MKGNSVIDIVKNRFYKNSLAMIVAISMVLSLLTGFSLNSKSVAAETNLLKGKKIVAMELGDYMGALTDDGDLYVWGRYAEQHFQSMGLSLESNNPYRILKDIKKFNLSLSENIALSNSGTLYGWWYGSNVKTILDNVKDIGILSKDGLNCTYYAVDNDDFLYTFGDNNYLGRENNDYNDYCSDSDIVLSDVKCIFPQKYPSKFCGAMTKNGDFYIWGESQISPVKISSNVQTFQMGYDNSVCLLKENGTLYTGTLDEESMVLAVKEVTDINEVAEIFLDYGGDCYALTKKGEVYLVNSETSQLVETEPILTNIDKMLLSDDVFAAVSKSNDMYIWLGQYGHNSNGIMGDEPSEEYNSEYHNPRVILSDVEEVSIYSDERVLAKKTNGDLYQWGRDSYGGMGSIPNSYTPTKHMSNVHSIIYNDGSLFGVIGDDGNCYMWGFNYFKNIVYNANAVVYNPYCITTATGVSVTDGGADEVLDDDSEDSESHKPTAVKKPNKVSGLVVKNKKKKEIIVTWSQNTNVSGFQIQYAQNKKFTKKKKSKMVGKNTSQKTITKLEKGKTYYVRVRAYKKSLGEKIYGGWSEIKKVKIKK